MIIKLVGIPYMYFQIIKWTVYIFKNILINNIFSNAQPCEEINSAFTWFKFTKKG